MFFKYYYDKNNSLINEPFNTSTNNFSSKDRHSKLRKACRKPAESLQKACRKPDCCEMVQGSVSVNRRNGGQRSFSDGYCEYHINICITGKTRNLLDRYFYFLTHFDSSIYKFSTIFLLNPRI